MHARGVTDAQDNRYVRGCVSASVFVRNSSEEEFKRKKKCSPVNSLFQTVFMTVVELRPNV